MNDSDIIYKKYDFYFRNNLIWDKTNFIFYSIIVNLIHSLVLL